MTRLRKLGEGITPPKTTIESQHDGLEDDFPLPEVYSQFHLNLPGCTADEGLLICSDLSMIRSITTQRIHGCMVYLPTFYHRNKAKCSGFVYIPAPSMAMPYNSHLKKLHENHKKSTYINVGKFIPYMESLMGVSLFNHKVHSPMIKG